LIFLRTLATVNVQLQRRRCVVWKGRSAFEGIFNPAFDVVRAKQDRCVFLQKVTCGLTQRSIFTYVSDRFIEARGYESEGCNTEKLGADFLPRVGLQREVDAGGDEEL